ncbi:FkbM family methyltransferase [Smaragdicoccus niigatensis]|uniref:FkbM family methyltransferase n=1 Tax=Smaragdicoccus niigatensis TaxID=359359 RepID=UPI00037E4543|nr:FkbM family methyltransferase [Smaragdicoccus niigatensis]
MPKPSQKTTALGRAGWTILGKATAPLRGRGLATRFPILWTAHSRVRRALGVNRVQVLGHDFEVDANDTLHIAMRGSYELEETAWYQANVKTGDVVLEVGANIGYFTLLFAKLVGPTGLVLAFEPDPEISAILRRNVARNGYHNVDIRQVAAGAVSEQRQLHYSSENRGDNRFFALDGDTSSVAVEVRALDDELEGLGRPIDLLKMDIQGFEPIALAGMHRVLSTNPPKRILMEFWPDGITAMGNDPAALLTTLRGAGYSIGELDSGVVKPVDDAELTARFTPGDKRWVNLVCERRS